MDLTVHHVTARGRRGWPIFLDDADRSESLERLGAVGRTQGWRCLAHCLMGNHTHLLIEAQRLRAGIRALRRVDPVGERDPPERPGPLANAPRSYYLGARE